MDLEERRQDFKASYMFSGEYEMYEFSLGNSFNYAEMASLIAPRPFMVERGHDDRVGIDEWIAYEYAKVRRLYSDSGYRSKPKSSSSRAATWSTAKARSRFWRGT